MVLNSRFLVSRLMGSNNAWLPSRRSVLHHTGTLFRVRVGHCRSGRSMGGNGRYFFEGSFNMAASLRDDTRDFSVENSSLGSSLRQRRLVARVCLRLGRKKKRKQRARRGRGARGESRLLVQDHGLQPTMDAGGLVNCGTRVARLRRAEIAPADGRERAKSTGFTRWASKPASCARLLSSCWP